MIILIHIIDVGCWSSLSENDFYGRTRTVFVENKAVGLVWFEGSYLSRWSTAAPSSPASCWFNTLNISTAVLSSFLKKMESREIYMAKTIQNGENT